MERVHIRRGRSTEAVTSKIVIFKGPHYTHTEHYVASAIVKKMWFIQCGRFTCVSLLHRFGKKHRRDYSDSENDSSESEPEKIKKKKKHKRRRARSESDSSDDESEKVKKHKKRRRRRERSESDNSNSEAEISSKKKTEHKKRQRNSSPESDSYHHKIPHKNNNSRTSYHSSHRHRK